MPIDQVERAWGGILKLVRQGLLGLPSRTAPRIHDLETIPEIREVLVECVHEILTDLSAAKIEYASDSAEAAEGLAEPEAEGSA